MKQEQLTIHLEPTVLARLRRLAAKRKISLAALVRHLIDVGRRAEREEAERVAAQNEVLG